MTPEEISLEASKALLEALGLRVITSPRHIPTRPFAADSLLRVTHQFDLEGGQRWNCEALVLKNLNPQPRVVSITLYQGFGHADKIVHVYLHPIGVWVFRPETISANMAREIGKQDVLAALKSYCLA